MILYYCDSKKDKHVNLEKLIVQFKLATFTDEEGHTHRQPTYTLSYRPQEPSNLLHPAVISDNKTERSGRDCDMNQ